MSSSSLPLLPQPLVSPTTTDNPSIRLSVRQQSGNPYKTLESKLAIAACHNPVSARELDEKSCGWWCEKYENHNLSTDLRGQTARKPPDHALPLFQHWFQQSSTTYILHTVRKRRTLGHVVVTKSSITSTCERRDPHNWKSTPHPYKQKQATQQQPNEPAPAKTNHNVAQTQAIAITAARGGEKEERKLVGFGFGRFLIVFPHSELIGV